MRVVLLLLLIVVQIAAWAQSSPARPGHAAASVRFLNANKFPIYLDATSHDGVIWPQALSTPYHRCGEGCDCFALAPPLPRVRVLAPGAQLASTWSGHYYELQACVGTGPDCVCALEKQAAPAAYEARVAGARAVRMDPDGASTASGDYQDGVVPDLSRGACHASVRFDLGAGQSVAAVPILCDAPKSR